MHKKVKFKFQNNMLNIKNLSGELCKIGKDKIIRTVVNIVLHR